MSIITPSIVLILSICISIIIVLMLKKNILNELEWYFFIIWILIIKDDLVFIKYDKINCSVMYSLQ